MGGFLSHLSPVNNSEVFDASCGPIRGNIYQHDEKTVDGYLGIPYAKPPIGELRYKKPIPAEKWTETRDCYKYSPICPQSGGFSKMPILEMFEKSEKDCLTLNVFVPRGNSTDKNGFPVMVFIHGGGFEVGMSSGTNDYSVSGILPLHGIIVVSINYRLGPLGFLTTGDDICKGNMGLWDQTLALKWVQSHIKSFGGNPDNVTIFGASAGAASVDLLALSPHSRDLFKRYIGMSGTANCDFAIRTKEMEAKIFRDFAIFYGYSGNDSKSLMEWYMSQDVEIFTNPKGFKSTASGFLLFVPNLDGNFFPKPLDELRKEAPKKDVMLGVGEYEGICFTMQDPNMPVTYKKIDDVLMSTYGEDIVNNVDGVHKMIIESYTKNIDNTDTDAAFKTLVEFVGDAYFNIGVLDTARSATKYGNCVYLYSFDYNDPNNFGEMAAIVPFKAATHCSDQKYVMGEGGFGKFIVTETELKMIDKMGIMFSNFAKYGNPNGDGVVEWEKYSIDKPDRYYQITMPDCQMKNGFQNGRLDILDDINNKYGKKYQHIIHGNNI